MENNGDNGTKRLIRLQPRSFKILWSYESSFPRSDPCSPKKNTWLCWGQAPHLTGQRYGGGTQNHYSMNVDFVKILWWFNGILRKLIRMGYASNTCGWWLLLQIGYPPKVICVRDMMVNHQSFGVAYFQTISTWSLVEWEKLIQTGHTSCNLSVSHWTSLSGMWGEIPICGTLAKIIEDGQFFIEAL